MGDQHNNSKTIMYNKSNPNQSIPEQAEPKTKSNRDFEMKDLEILKFKTIAFVKTYENEFRKMKQKIQHLEKENQSLKSKLKDQMTIE